MSRITILGVRRHGAPDWIKGAAGAVVLAALLGGAFYAGTRYGTPRVWTHTIRCSDSCRDYWQAER